MRKNFFIPLVGYAILLGILAGCNKSDSPVIPAASQAVLKLSLPKFLLTAPANPRVGRGVAPKNTVPDYSMGRLKYCLVLDGLAPIKGSIDFNSGSDLGNVIIPLPKAGNWLVAAEWFQLYDPNAGVVTPRASVSATLQEYPEFAGADRVSVQGTTGFALNMEDFAYNGYNCYNPYLADYGYEICIGNFGYYNGYYFDSGYFTGDGTGDIQAAYDSVTGSEYLTSGNSVVPSIVSKTSVETPVMFVYLGNGDLVNFPSVPENAVYYPTTQEARAAVAGPGNGAMAGGDIYVVKGVMTAAGTNGGKVWIQVGSSYPYYCTGGSSSGGSLGFWFIYNGEDFNYMKFDETTYGHNNCNQNVVGT